MNMQNLVTTMQTPGKIFEARCSQLRFQPDPSVMRILEKAECCGDVQQLDCSGMVLNIQSFKVLMELCAVLPRLQKLDFVRCHLKNEHVQLLVDMASEHPGLKCISLEGNRRVGFTAAPQLLGLLRENENVTQLGIDGTSLANATRTVIANQLYQNQRHHPMLGDIGEIERTHSSGAETPKRKKRYDGGAEAKPESFLKASSGLDIPQRHKNEKVTNAWGEHGDRIKGVAAEACQTMAKLRKTLQEETESTPNLVDRFSATYKWAEPLEYTIASLGELQVKEKELSLKCEVEDPCYAPTHYVPKHDVAGNIEELFWIKDYEQRQENIEKLSESLKGVGPGSDGCIDVLTDFSGLMEDHEVQMQQVKDFLANGDRQLAMFAERIKSLEADMATATENEEWRTVEVAQDAKILTQEEYIEQLGERLTAVKKHSSENFNKHVDSAIEMAKIELQQAAYENDDFTARLKHDMAYTRNLRDETKRGIETQALQFAGDAEDLKRSMSKNQTRQSELWITVSDALRELDHLNKQKGKELEAWLRKEQDMVREQARAKLGVEVLSQHLDRLVTIQNAAVGCQELLKDWTDNLDNARAAILKYAAASSQEADDLALNENRRYLDVFRGFWHAIENAVMRREKRIDELDRQIRSVEFQIEFAKESCDPELPRYKENLMDLETKKMEVNSKLKKFAASIEQRVAEYLPIEESLKKHGDEFISPLLEASEHKIKEMARMLIQKSEFLERQKRDLVDRDHEELEAHREIIHSPRSKPTMSAVLSPPRSAAPAPEIAIPNPPKSAGARKPSSPRSSRGTTSRGLVFDPEPATGPGFTLSSSGASAFGSTMNSLRSMISSVGPPDSGSNTPLAGTPRPPVKNRQETGGWLSGSTRRKLLALQNHTDAELFTS
jgi:hypothetical protein